MRLTGPALLAAVLLRISLVGAAGQQPSQPTSTNPPVAGPHISQPEAQVLITVSGNSGSPVPAPAKTDLLVRDDRHSVDVNELRSVKDQPLIFSLLVDASGSMRSTKDLQIEGAIRLFRALANGRNRGYLILFRDDVATNNEFIDSQTAEQVLRRENSRIGSTALYDAIVYAVTKQLSLAKNSSSTRRAIFLFSDGGDNISRSSFEHTMTVLEREGIPVFTIGTPSEKWGKRDMEHLHALSQNTGGDMVFLAESGDFVSDVLSYLHNQYLLNFSAFPAKPHKLHSLEVKSVSQSIEVSAPTHYLAP